MLRIRRFRSVFVSVIAAVITLLAATVLGAHDFWLVPDAFQIASGESLHVRGQTSSHFPASESAVALDRIADARILGATSDERLTDLSHSGTSLLIRHRPTSAGQRIVAVILKPRSVRESAASFRRYLELEGAPDALARLEREGLLRGRDSVTRRYAKYAKTIVEVGQRGPRAFARSVGHPLEFVPLNDPSVLKMPDTLHARLLYRGQPLAGATAHAGRARSSIAATSSAASSPEADLTLTADANGVLHVPLAQGGLWNVRTIHVVQSEPNSGANWDTHWATLVFHAGQSAERRSGSATDSADVAHTIDHFHEALAKGDSTGALALLALDAVILESGGVETRDEYRSHHLPGDIAFARAVKSVRSPMNVTIRGDVAWASSTTTTQGEYRGRPINSLGAELVVLTRSPDGWRINAIHWSSRQRRP